MKKQVTYDVAEKPVFDNDMDIKNTIVFLKKVEDTVKLYNRHSKALKEYMLKNDIPKISVDGYNARIETGTARMTLSQERLELFLYSIDKNLEDFKVIGNPPKSLKIDRD